MKKILILIFNLSLIFPAPYLFPQDSGRQFKTDTTPNEYYRVIVRTVPYLTLELNGNYDFGIFELSANNNGDFSSSEFIKGENFGVRHGLGIYGAVKYNLQESGHIRLFISGSYSRFSSKFNKLFTTQLIKDYANYNVYTLGVGVENSFTPSYKFKPVVGIGFIASVISGAARIEDPTTYALQDKNIVPAFRLGLTLYSGIEYLLNNKYGLNFGLRIVDANLWLKSTNVSDVPGDIYLNDARVLPRIPFSGFRQFVWGEIYFGVNYYFGIHQKEYIIKKILH
jgi:hypothetical protein